MIGSLASCFLSTSTTRSRHAVWFSISRSTSSSLETGMLRAFQLMGTLEPLHPVHRRHEARRRQDPYPQGLSSRGYPESCVWHAVGSSAAVGLSAGTEGARRATGVPRAVALVRLRLLLQLPIRCRDLFIEARHHSQQGSYLLLQLPRKLQLLHTTGSKTLRRTAANPIPRFLNSARTTLMYRTRVGTNASRTESRPRTCRPSSELRYAFAFMQSSSAIGFGAARGREPRP